MQLSRMFLRLIILNSYHFSILGKTSEHTDKDLRAYMPYMPPELDLRGLRFGISEKIGDICPVFIFAMPAGDFICD